MKLLLQPGLVRLCHWILVTCIFTLLFTGFYLDRPWPWLHLPLHMVRQVHMIFGVTLVFNFLTQVYYYLYTGKYTEMILRRRDLADVPSFLRYVLFITAKHPNYGRYNPGQKLLFMSWMLAILLSATTGSNLIFPDNTLWLQRLLGGLQTVRVIHYFAAVFFATTVVLHVYLVFTEDPAKLQAMFTGYILKEPHLTPKTGRPEQLPPGDRRGHG